MNNDMYQHVSELLDYALFYLTYCFDKGQYVHK